KLTGPLMPDTMKELARQPPARQQDAQAERRIFLTELQLMRRLAYPVPELNGWFAKILGPSAKPTLWFCSSSRLRQRVFGSFLHYSNRSFCRVSSSYDY